MGAQGPSRAATSQPRDRPAGLGPPLSTWQYLALQVAVGHPGPWVPEKAHCTRLRQTHVHLSHLLRARADHPCPSLCLLRQELNGTSQDQQEQNASYPNSGSITLLPRTLTHHWSERSTPLRIDRPRGTSSMTTLCCILGPTAPDGSCLHPCEGKPGAGPPRAW